uniref:Uncharacterized protein n=1 Tax=Kalanchoe fedtschenkoi TaxID=63787 RepID=A0A7N0TLN3_KALFE
MIKLQLLFSFHHRRLSHVITSGSYWSLFTIFLFIHLKPLNFFIKTIITHPAESMRTFSIPRQHKIWGSFPARALCS